MIDPRERIWNAIDPLARAYGFKAQRRTNAFLARPETTSVLNLQRSQWGEQFYFNCGVWLNRFGQQLHFTAPEVMPRISCLEKMR